MPGRLGGLSLVSVVIDRDIAGVFDGFESGLRVPFFEKFCDCRWDHLFPVFVFDYCFSDFSCVYAVVSTGDFVDFWAGFGFFVSLVVLALVTCHYNFGSGVEPGVWRDVNVDAVNPKCVIVYVSDWDDYVFFWWNFGFF